MVVEQVITDHDIIAMKQTCHATQIALEYFVDSRLVFPSELINDELEARASQLRRDIRLWHQELCKKYAAGNPEPIVFTWNTEIVE